MRPLPLLVAASLLLTALPVHGEPVQGEPAAAQLEVEKLELTARVEPVERALYVRAAYFLRNRGRASPDSLELLFPVPVSPRLEVRAVWDRGGELPWRADTTSEDGARQLLVGLRAPLLPGKKLVLVASYDLDLEGYEAAGESLRLTQESAQLAATGWYPLPRGSEPALPRRLRLTVRLPKEWQVAAPVKFKRLRDGTALASYELELQRLEPGAWLFRAGVTLPP